MTILDGALLFWATLYTYFYAEAATECTIIKKHTKTM